VTYRRGCHAGVAHQSPGTGAMASWKAASATDPVQIRACVQQASENSVLKDYQSPWRQPGELCPDVEQEYARALKAVQIFDKLMHDILFQYVIGEHQTVCFSCTIVAKVLMTSQMFFAQSSVRAPKSSFHAPRQPGAVHFLAFWSCCSSTRSNHPPSTSLIMCSTLRKARCTCGV